jgi:RHS repeat-associated protein
VVRTAPDGTKTFYVHGLGLLHEETGAAVRYYHHDRRGDTVALTDASGVITDRVAYGTYGEIVARTGTTNTPFLFNGRWGVQTDSNGLYFHRARYYHPGLRRFLNQDSVLGNIVDSASMNRFAYANGCPQSLVDPFGLSAWDTVVDLGRYLLTRDYWTKVLDNVQTELDVIGLIPVFGEPADGINGIIYALRGDYTSAALSGMAMIPTGGQAATAAKLGMKYGDEVASAVKQVGHAAEGASSQILRTSTQQLQSKFKHAADFGIQGNYNAANGAAFRSAINQHINSPGVQVIQGTYRGTPVTHYVNPQTGLNVMSNSAGEFLSGWKLSPQQLQHVTTTGKLGGG